MTPLAGPRVPRQGPCSLTGVLGSVAGVLRVAGRQDDLGLDPGGAADRVCTVLVDGLGARLLAERSGHAPFLRSIATEQPAGVPVEIDAVVPTTTAANIGSLGTGVQPGRHGLLGYRVLDPASGSVVNHLRWPAELDPTTWQPVTTELERLAGVGMPTTYVGPAKFAGSGLTVAALRGAAYAAAESLDDRVDAAVRLLAAGGPGRHVHVYWGDVDKVGHARGCGSHEWGSEVERVDAALARLARRMPHGTVLVVTADHGMVDARPAERLDLAAEPGLRTDVVTVAGEPRFTYLHCRDGRAAEVAGRWRDRLGESAWVRTRAEADREGWFGGLDEQMAGRVGDVVVAARGRATVVDSATDSASSLAMVGHHGSLTDDEVAVPLLRAWR